MVSHNGVVHRREICAARGSKDSERSRSSLDVSLWTGTLNAPRRDRASTVVPARILNGGDERYLRSAAFLNRSGSRSPIEARSRSLRATATATIALRAGDAAGSAAAHSSSAESWTLVRSAHGIRSEVTEHACCQVL